LNDGVADNLNGASARIDRGIPTSQDETTDLRTSGMKAMLSRRQLLQNAAPLALALLATPLAGCRNVQHARVLGAKDPGTVGPHAAGGETWKPLVQESVDRLLCRQATAIQLAGHEVPHARKRVCFVGIENKSAEELGDFKQQIYQHIETLISQSDAFEPIDRKYVQAGLEQSGLRADQLFIVNNQRMFAASLEKFEQPFEYLLYATITSVAMRSNTDSQREYLLTLELIDIRSGRTEKESAELRKEHRRGPFARLRA